MIDIDSLCQKTANTSMLNALHACRENHPWNKTTTSPWTGAWFLAKQRDEFTAMELGWLLYQAKKHGEFNA